MHKQVKHIIGMHYALCGLQPPNEIVIADTPSQFSNILQSWLDSHTSSSLHPILQEGFRNNLLKSLNDWLIDQGLIGLYQNVFNTHYRTKFLNLKNQRDLIVTTIFENTRAAQKIKKVPLQDFFTATYIEQVFVDFLKHISKENVPGGYAGLYIEMYEVPAGFMSYFGENEALILRWPDVFETTSDGVLHSPHGPALRWGAETHYFYNGWHIHHDFFENPHAVSASLVLSEKNVEKRRAYMEILGSSRFAELLDLVVKDQAADRFGNLIELYRTRTIDELAGEHLQFVKVTCPSTGRNYMLCVPPDLDSARDAVAWTFGKSADDYRPLEET